MRGNKIRISTPIKVLLSVFICFLLSGCGNLPNFGSKNEEVIERPADMDRTIVVMPYGDSGTFWDEFHDAAQESAEKEGYKIRWEKPPPVWTIKRQDELIAKITKLKPAGIILGPLHRNKLQYGAIKAFEAEVPVVMVGSDEDTSHKLTYIGSDNDAIGKELGTQAAKKFSPSQKIALVNVQPGMQATDIRKYQILQVLSGHQILEVPFPYDSDMNYQPSNLRKIIANSLDVFLKKHDDVAAFITLDENSTAATWNKLQELPAEKRPPIFGVSEDQSIIDAAKNGDFGVLIKQDPREMGVVSTQTIIDYDHRPLMLPLQNFISYDIIGAERTTNEEAQ